MFDTKTIAMSFIRDDPVATHFTLNLESDLVTHKSQWPNTNNPLHTISLCFISYRCFPTKYLNRDLKGLSNSHCVKNICDVILGTHSSV